MSISMKCAVCKNADRRRMVELAWNGGMDATSISNTLGGVPNSATILKHLKQHAEGEAAIRAVEVKPVTPVRERILALQTMQLDEIERRIEMAKQRANELNETLDKLEEMGAEGAAETPRHDWSEFTDILGKDMQSAIGSILKTQGLSDKREKATADLKLGLFDAMARAGLAPKGLVGGDVTKRLLPGDEGEDDPDGD